MGKSFFARLFGQKQGYRRRYEILNEIARGGMSIVYRARNRETDETVAIKVLRPESMKVAERIQQIFDSKSEGEIAMQLSHPNVITTYEYGQDGDEYYIVMEYIDGPNLKYLVNVRDEGVRKNRLRLVLEIGRGLQFIHENGLIHRDFCPKNVLVDQNMRPKIIDFGLTIPRKASQKELWDRSGTPSYMAPEQIRGQLADVRTDIYAFGVSIYEIITFHRPFKEGKTQYGKMQPHLNIDPPPPSTHDPTVPKEMDQVILKAMSKQRDRRYQTMDAMMRDLQKAIEKFPDYRGEGEERALG